MSICNEPRNWCSIFTVYSVNLFGCVCALACAKVNSWKSLTERHIYMYTHLHSTYYWKWREGKYTFKRNRSTQLHFSFNPCNVQAARTHLIPFSNVHICEYAREKASSVSRFMEYQAIFTGKCRKLSHTRF